jgi:citrate synthase
MEASNQTAPKPATLTITDNRTGKKYEVPIEHDTIRATDLRQIKVNADDFGMMTYDPAFMNTAACRSKITFIDGDKGILRYRGYPLSTASSPPRHSWTIGAFTSRPIPSSTKTSRS